MQKYISLVYIWKIYNFKIVEIFKMSIYPKWITWSMKDCKYKNTILFNLENMNHYWELSLLRHIQRSLVPPCGSEASIEQLQRTKPVTLIASSSPQLTTSAAVTALLRQHLNQTHERPHSIHSKMFQVSDRPVSIFDLFHFEVVPNEISLSRLF